MRTERRIMTLAGISVLLAGIAHAPYSIPHGITTENFEEAACRSISGIAYAIISGRALWAACHDRHISKINDHT